MPRRNIGTYSSDGGLACETKVGHFFKVKTNAAGFWSDNQSRPAGLLLPGDLLDVRAGAKRLSPYAFCQRSC
jgi:hypothetical protein